jgi:hypothetical protein
MRKNRDQLKSLKRAYEECNGTWTREEQTAIARKLGLKEQQVYKWSWDQLQKRREVAQGVGIEVSSKNDKKVRCCDEFDEAIDFICALLKIDVTAQAQEIVSQTSPVGKSTRITNRPGESGEEKYVSSRKSSIDQIMPQKEIKL